MQRVYYDTAQACSRLVPARRQWKAKGNCKRNENCYEKSELYTVPASLLDDMWHYIDHLWRASIERVFTEQARMPQQYRVMTLRACAAQFVDAWLSHFFDNNYTFK